MQEQDSFETLYKVTKGHLDPLWILYQELVIKKGMSYEKVANTFNIALNRLPYMEILYEQVSRAVGSKKEVIIWIFG